MTARGEEQVDSLLQSLRQAAESQLKNYKDYFGPKHHEMQEMLQGFLSAMGSWSDEFPQVISIPNGRSNASVGRRVLRHHNTGRDPRSKSPPSELGSIGRIPVRHDYFAKLEPTIVPIGGYSPDVRATSVRALHGKSLNQQKAKKPHRKKGVNVHASTPHIRDCHIVLDKIPRKKLCEAIQPHMLESDEGSSYCSELPCDPDYLPLDLEVDCSGSDVGEDRASPQPENLLQRTRDSSLNHPSSDERCAHSPMGTVMKDCSTANESQTFVEGDSTQLSRTSCKEEEYMHPALGLPCSPSTVVISEPGECGQMSDNSLPDSTADPDVLPNSPSLLDHSSDSVNSTTATGEEPCAPDRYSTMENAAPAGYMQTPVVNNAQSGTTVVEDSTDTEVMADITDTGANKDEVQEGITGITDTKGLATLNGSESITDIACSEDSLTSSRDDLLLSSQHAGQSNSPLTLNQIHSPPSVSGYSPIVDTDVLEDDATNELPSYLQSPPRNACSSPSGSPRDCTQSSSELPESHLDASGDIFSHDSKFTCDHHRRLLLLEVKSETDADTLLATSAVSASTPGSTVSALTNVKAECSSTNSTQPVAVVEDDLDRKHMSSMSSTPESGRRRKSMKLLKRRRLLSSSPPSPFESSLSSVADKSWHESPLTPKAKRPCMELEENAPEGQDTVQAEGQLSSECKAHEETIVKGELPCFSGEASVKEEETEEDSGSVSLVLEGNDTSHMGINNGRKSAVDAKRDGSEGASTTGQMPETRLRVLRGRKSRNGSCIACNATFMLNTGQNFVKHPKLDAFLCQKCHTFYFSGDFTYSNGKQNECFVCGDGGNVAECDTPGELCPHSVCIKCIRRVEGFQKVKKLQTDEGADFFCYVCNPEPIQHLLSEFKRGSLTLGWMTNGDKPKHELMKNQRLDTSKVEFLERDGCSSSCGVQRQGESMEDSSNAAGKQADAKKSASKRCLQSSLSIDHKSECSSHSSDVDSTSDEALSSDEDISDLHFFSGAPIDKVKDCPSEKEIASKRGNATTEEVDSASDSSKKGMHQPEKRGKNAIVRQSFTNKHTWRKGNSSGVGSESEDELSGHGSEIMEGEEEGGGDGESEEEMQAEGSKHDMSAKRKIPGKKKPNHFLSDTSSEDELHQPRIDLSERPERELQTEEMCEDLPELKYTTQRRALQRVVSSDSEEDGCVPEKKTKVEPTEELAEDNSEEDEVDNDRVDQILSNAQEKTKEKKKHRSKGRVPRPRYKFLDSDFEEEEEEEGEEEDASVIVLSDSSESDKDKEASTPSPLKKDANARKNIRKIMPKQKLADLTKQAQKEEQDRQKRLKERGEWDLRGNRLILEGTEEEPVVEVRRSLVPSLKPHQREGVRFLWDYTCESVEKIKEGQGSGALLAHCMGLGKTLQVIAFLDALLDNSVTGFKRMLVIVPKNTISNWVDEFHRWLKDENDYYIINFNQYKNKFEQSQVIESWSLRGGIGLVSYDTYRILTSVKGKQSSRQYEKFKTWLRDPGPDVVVCDEGHVLRNCKSALSQAVNKVATQRRIVLTGTPLQNNLQEYYTMVSFVKPNLLGTLKEFNNRFGNPIKNGQCRDATSFDVILMKRRAHVLNRLLSGCVQRKDYRVLTECLPSKHEYVLKIRLSPVQEQLYCALLKQRGSDGVIQSIFKFFQTMMRIWNHPWMLKLYEERMEWGEDDDDSDSDLGGFICDDSDVEEELAEIERAKTKNKGKRKKSVSSRSSSSTRSVSPASLPDSPSPIVSTKAEASAVGEGTAGPLRMSGLVHASHTSSSSGCPVIVDLTGDSERNPHEVCEPEKKSHGFWYEKLLSDEMEHIIELSGKLLFLKDLLVETKRLGEKVLVFSQSLLTLDMIEHFLCSEEFGQLTPDLDYFRLDGATAANERATMTRNFNCHKESRVRLFLISTRAGCLGINLVSANRVVIFDACWNPSHDLQALFRVYRYGQTKPVFIYRLIAKGTMEEKIYDRQVTKEAIALRVVDKKQIDRHFSNSDLSELLVYTPAPPPSQDVVVRERPEADPLLCGILDKLQPEWLLSYHSHDSLLVHREFEELSQRDKDSAWEEYLSSMRQVEGQAYYAFAGMPGMQGTQTVAAIGSVTVSVPTAQQQAVHLQALNHQWGPDRLISSALLQRQQQPTSHLLSPGAVLNQMQGSSNNSQHPLKVLRTTTESIRQLFQQRDLDSDLFHLSHLSKQGNKSLMLPLQNAIILKLNERGMILNQIKEKLKGISALGPVVTKSAEFFELQSVIAQTSQVLFTYNAQLQRVMSTM